MEIHLDHELDLLKKELSIMCNQSVTSLVLAIRALKNRDLSLAQEVINNDHEIDMQENKIDGMLLAIIALQQPYAIDLRFLASAMKINNDLERVADKAVTIARSIEHLTDNVNIDEQIKHLTEMAEYSLDMIKKAFKCFLNKDAESVVEVIKEDKELDKLNEEAYKEVVHLITENKEEADTGLHIYRISTSLERIGDLAKNISEEAIYYIRGEIIKHK